MPVERRKEFHYNQLWKDLFVGRGLGFGILTKHGRYTATGDRLVAAGTECALLRVEMSLTVRLSLVLEESAGRELTTTVGADEALSVPLAIQSGDECGRNWFTFKESKDALISGFISVLIKSC